MEILVRADNHYACPEVLDWCEANRIDYVLGLAPSSTLRRHITGLEKSTAARFKAVPNGGKVRRLKEFFDAARTWSQVLRIVARIEAGSGGTDVRFIVTNLGHGSGRSLYQDLYCRRPGGEPYQGLENPPRRRPYLMPQSHGQPVPAVPARGHLLVAVEPGGR